MSLLQTQQSTKALVYVFKRVKLKETLQKTNLFMYYFIFTTVTKKPYKVQEQAEMRPGTRKSIRFLITLIKLLIMSFSWYLISLNQHCSMISNKFVFMRKLPMNPQLPGIKTMFLDKLIYSNSLHEAQSFRDTKPYVKQPRANR